MFAFVLYFLLLGLPFAVGPIAPSFFETPKIYTTYVLIEFLILLSLFKFKIPKKFSFSYFDYVIFSIFIFSFLTFLFHPTPLSFYGNEFRKQGLFLLWHLLIFSFLIEQNTITFTKNFMYIARVALTALVISLFFFGTTMDDRFVGVFGEPNSLASYSLFIWPFTQSLGFLAIPILITVLTGSRSAFIALIVQLVFLFCKRTFRMSTKWALLISLCIITVSLTLPFLEPEIDYQNRALIWKTAVSAGLARPYWGWGFGNTEIALSETAHNLKNNIQYIYVDSSHNIILDWWVQGGIIGILLFGLCIGTPFYQISKQNMNKEIAIEKVLLSFLGVFTCLLFNPGSIAILVPFFWLIGVLNKILKKA